MSIDNHQNPNPSSADIIRKRYSENPNINREDLAKEAGCGVRHVHRIISGINTDKYPVKSIKKEIARNDQPRIKSEYKEDSGQLEINSFTVHTVEQLLEIANVDTERWEVDKYVTNSWGVTMKNPDDPENPIYRTNYQVKIWLKPLIKKTLEETIELLKKSIPTISPTIIKAHAVHDGQYAWEMAIHDAHIGQLSWDRETRKGNYDIKIAPAKYLDVCERLLNTIPPDRHISKIFFPVGHDYMHIENLSNETFFSKNKLDSDVRLPYVVEKAVLTIIDAINMCNQVAPVEVVLVPGNHDIHASFWLALLLKMMYKHVSDNIIVDNEPSMRKVRIWGDLMVGFAHDISFSKERRTVNMLPHLWPKEWGISVFREWHTGHQHTKKEIRYAPTHTAGGVIIRQIPSMSTIDAWASQMAFTGGIPASQAFLWDKKWGITHAITQPILYDDIN